MVIQKHEKTVIRKQQIIDAARKLIVDRGSENVTVRALAEAVGFSEGALYRHFKSKRDILAFLVDDIDNTLLADIDRATEEVQSPLKALERLLKDHLSAIEQRRGISFQVIAEIISLGDKKLDNRVSNAIDKYIARLEQLLLDGVKAAELRDDIDIHAAATLFFSMVQGLVSIWALSNYSFNLQERYEPLWSLFRNSISKH